MFDILEVVGGVLSEPDLANLAQRVLLMRPSEGIVEDVDARDFCLLGIHDLEVHNIGRVIAAFNCVVEVLDVVVGCFAGETECFVCLEVLDSGFGLDVPFDICEGAVLLAELVCVNAEGVDVTKLG